MAIDDQLLRLLACPVTLKPLVLVSGGGAKQRLFCREAGLYYRIDDPDIPVLLPEEAELEDGSSARELVAKLADPRKRRA